MKARVFFDAFAECLVSVALARTAPTTLRERMRAYTIVSVARKHGEQHAEATGRMFDKLWADMQNPGAST